MLIKSNTLKQLNAVYKACTVEAAICINQVTICYSGDKGSQSFCSGNIKSVTVHTLYVLYCPDGNCEKKMRTCQRAVTLTTALLYSHSVLSNAYT